MTLADHILEARGKAFDRESGGGVTKLADAISRAQRFVFSQEASDACFQLASSKPSSILDATQFSRVPFDVTWLEWLPPQDRKDDPDRQDATIIPDKMGCLLECFGPSGKQFAASLVWEFAHDRLEVLSQVPSNVKKKVIGPAINISPIALVVSWVDSWPEFDRHDAVRYARRVADGVPAAELMGSARAAYKHDPREIEAARRLAKARLPAVCPFRPDFERRAEAELMWINGLRDWVGEINMIISMLCLLNSKTCVDVCPVVNSRADKSRRKAGKLPLVPYSAVQLHLSKQHQRYVSDSTMSAEEVRLHMVRGHFKIRKSGVFWWRPFPRGNAALGEVRRAGYMVDA